MKRPLKDQLIEIIAIVISLAIPLLIYLCGYEEVRCEWCGEVFHEDEIITDFNLNNICLSCADEQMRKIAFGECAFCIECKEYYESSCLDDCGMCESCNDK